MAKKSTNLDMNDIVAEIQQGLSDIKMNHIKINEEEVKGVNTGISIYDEIGNKVPLAKFLVLTGGSMGAKSSWATHIMGAFQKEYENAVCFYIDAEQAMSKQRLIDLGADGERTILLSGSIPLEHLLPLIKQLLAKKKEMKLMDVPSVIVVDSLSVLIPGILINSEDNKDGVSAMPGVKAKILSQTLPRLCNLADEYNTTIICIAHLRERIQLNPYQKQWTNLKALQNKTLGMGEIINYAPYQIIALTRKEVIDREKFGFTGQISEVLFVKNKNCDPESKCNIVLNYKKGFSDFWTKYMMIKDEKQMTSSGRQPNTYLSNYKDFKFNPMEAETIYKTNPEFKQKFDELYEKVKNKLLDPNAKKIKDEPIEDEDLNTGNDVFDEAEDIIENEEE